MSGYTKGPWRVEGEGIKAIVRGDDVTIVAVRHRLPAKVHEANARLMAAAPELVEALKAIFEGNFFYHKAGDEQVYQLAKSAIAKAEGK